VKETLEIINQMQVDGVDRQRLKDIVERHGLSAKWNQFEQKFLKGQQ
jgi:hypothetical protein